MILAHDLLPLSEKELFEGVLIWLLGLAAGAKLVHKHVVQPLHRHHAEVMAAHKAAADHHGYEL